VITVPSHTKKDNPKGCPLPHPHRQRRTPPPTSSFQVAGNIALPVMSLKVAGDRRVRRGYCTLALHLINHRNDMTHGLAGAA
jgi:hypothetical protein